MPFLSVKTLPTPIDDIAQAPKALTPCHSVPLEPTPTSSSGAVGPVHIHPHLNQGIMCGSALLLTSITVVLSELAPGSQLDLLFVNSSCHLHERKIGTK